MGLLHSHHNDSSNTEKTKLQSKNTWNRVTLNTRLKSCFLCILMEAMGKKHQFDSEPSNCPSIGLQETTSTAHWWCHLQRKHSYLHGNQPQTFPLTLYSNEVCGSFLHGHWSTFKELRVGFYTFIFVLQLSDLQTVHWRWKTALYHGLQIESR